ncbi:hypothetical protein GCM10020331_003710 [Ectobacillus funiculus]
MSLAIREDEEITIIANGSDEQAAIVALRDSLSNKKIVFLQVLSK